MMIKFRAWDKENNRMQSWEELLAGKEFKAKLRDPEAHGMVLMMWTGLKDKNGVEIYEGDVIDVGTKTPFINRVAVDKKNAAFILIPIDSRWSSSYMYSWEDKSRYEVIGNIYKNPGLIQKEGNPTTK